jgi:hypothetical protein
MILNRGAEEVEEVRARAGGVGLRRGRRTGFGDEGRAGGGSGA